jgi:hypothetical protein
MSALFDERLIKRKRITEEQFQRALEQQRLHGGRWTHKAS